MTGFDKDDDAKDASRVHKVAAAEGASEESRKDQAAAEIMATLITKPTPPAGPNANPPATIVVLHPVPTTMIPTPAAVSTKAKFRPSAASIAAEAAAAWAAKQKQQQQEEQRTKKRKDVGSGSKATKAVTGGGNTKGGEGKTAKQPPSKKARALDVPAKTGTTTTTTSYCTVENCV